jgi:hypothetical protein
MLIILSRYSINKRQAATPGIWPAYIEYVFAMKVILAERQANTSARFF